MRSSFRALFLILATAAAGACASDPVSPLGDADYEGALTEFLQAPVSPDHPVRVLLEVPGASAPTDKAIIHVGSRTRVHVVESAGRVRAGGTGDLAPNDRLRVWTTGIELRSYPVQVFAERIEIIR